MHMGSSMGQPTQWWVVVLPLKHILIAPYVGNLIMTLLSGWSVQILELLDLMFLCIAGYTFNNMDELSATDMTTRRNHINISTLQSFDIQPRVKKQVHNRPHTCLSCGKSYAWKETLVRHMRLECGQVPNLQCPLCPMKFKRKDQLQAHMNCKRHSTVPNFQKNSSMAYSFSKHL